MPHITQNSTLRRWGERLILLTIGLLALRTWFLEGFPVLCRINGGSMAETLLGEHSVIRCGRCDREFAYDPGPFPLAFRLVCPSCGGVGDASNRPSLPGDCVLIDRSAYALSPPKRWGVVAFRRPAKDGELVVKRVVGLPGEHVELRGGNVVIDGKLQRKDLRQQRAMRILVHGNHSGVSPSRWRNLHGEAWAQGDRGWEHRSDSGQGIDWLVYNHEIPVAEGKPADKTPVTDTVYYNQGRVRWEEDVHPVADLMMSFRLTEVEGPGCLWFTTADGRDEWEIRLDLSRSTILAFANGHPLPVGETSYKESLRGKLLEVSLFDRQLLLAVNGRVLLATVAENESPPPGSAQPLGIGAQGPRVVLDSLCVYRDIYYTQAPAARGDEPPVSVTLKAGEYFVLGDNSPISEDSRSWREDRLVCQSWIVGKPLLVCYPPREISWGNWHFQVPDPYRIRYIR